MTTVTVGQLVITVKWLLEVRVDVMEMTEIISEDSLLAQLVRQVQVLQ